MHTQREHAELLVHQQQPAVVGEQVRRHLARDRLWHGYLLSPVSVARGMHSG